MHLLVVGRRRFGSDMRHTEDLAIACYLEAAYKIKPDLFAGAANKAPALFVNHWSDSSLLLVIAKLILMDLYNALAECDREYFRDAREKALEHSKLNQRVSGNAGAVHPSHEHLNLTQRGNSV